MDPRRVALPLLFLLAAVGSLGPWGIGIENASWSRDPLVTTWSGHEGPFGWILAGFSIVGAAASLVPGRAARAGATIGFAGPLTLFGALSLFDPPTPDIMYHFMKTFDSVRPGWGVLLLLGASLAACTLALLEWRDRGAHGAAGPVASGKR